jgi:hypothetical protein
MELESRPTGWRVEISVSFGTIPPRFTGLAVAEKGDEVLVEVE